MKSKEKNTNKATNAKKEKNGKQKKGVKQAKQNGFFKEVIKELKKVKWPDKKYMVKYSIATFVTIIASSLYFYAIFALFSLIKGLR